MALLEDSPNKMVTVFSAAAGEGRSTVARNLALALAEHTDVLLADPVAANLQRKLLPSNRVAGLLPPDLTRSAAFQRKVWLLPANRPLVGEAGQLAPRLEEAHNHGMYVVVDAPAAGVSSQSFLLAQKTGNVIYVMPNRRQDLDRHQQLLDHLKRLRVRVLGIVLNDC
jgi:Mrp family chromosome partitioning ATPase